MVKLLASTPTAALGATALLFLPPDTTPAITEAPTAAPTDHFEGTANPNAAGLAIATPRAGNLTTNHLFQGQPPLYQTPAAVDLVVDPQIQARQQEPLQAGFDPSTMLIAVVTLLLSKSNTERPKSIKDMQPDERLSFITNLLNAILDPHNNTDVNYNLLLADLIDNDSSEVFTVLLSITENTDIKTLALANIDLLEARELSKDAAHKLRDQYYIYFIGFESIAFSMLKLQVLMENASISEQDLILNWAFDILSDNNKGLYLQIKLLKELADITSKHEWTEEQKGPLTALVQQNISKLFGYFIVHRNQQSLDLLLEVSQSILSSLGHFTSSESDINTIRTTLLTSIIQALNIVTPPHPLSSQIPNAETMRNQITTVLQTLLTANTSYQEIVQLIVSQTGTPFSPQCIAAVNKLQNK